jgi:hypothetical protein
MAYSQPLRFRAPNGGSVFLPPGVGAGIFGLEPDVPEPPPLPEPNLGAYAGTPSIPTPPPDQGLLALPPTLAAPEDPSLVGTATGIARPGLAQLMPQATGPARPEPASPPQQQPRLTEDDIRAGGYASVLEQQQRAAGLERDAAVAQMGADKRAAEAEAKALAASGQREEEREVARASAHQATLADIAQRSAAIDRDIDNIANTKIDTSMRQPVLAAIGLAMGAIGQALAGRTDGSNPALDIMLKQRDASVQRQMADRDAAMRTVGLRRDQVAGLRQKLTDTNALYDGLAAAETRRMRNEIGRIAASSKSDATLAGLAKIDADLATEEAKLLGSAKDKQFAKDDRDRQFKEQVRSTRAGESRAWAGMAQSDRHHQDNLKLAREKEDNDITRARLAAEATGNTARAKALADAAKDNDERGVRDPVTAELLLTAKGKAMLADADKLEKRADELAPAGGTFGAQTGEQARMLRERASAMRGEAKSAHVARGRSAADAAKADAELRTSQRMLSLIDKIDKRIGEAGTRVLNQNELQAALDTEIGVLGLELKDLYVLGSLDQGAVDYQNRLTGGDATKMTTGTFLGAMGIGADSADKSRARLKALAKQVEARGYSSVTSLGLKPGDFKFRRDEEVDRPESKAARSLIDAKTPVELGAGERNVGGIRRGVDVAEKFLEGADQTASERRAAAVEEASSSRKYVGLSKEQEPDMDTLLANARQGGPAGEHARSKLVEIAASTATTKPALSNAVMGVLRDQAPEVYQQALAALPEDDRKQREVRSSVARESEPLPSLQDRAVQGQPDALQELQRRASEERGGAAARAWMRVLGEFDRQRRQTGKVR